MDHLREILKEVEELKRKEKIGSEQAFEYLKTKKELEKLIASLKNDNIPLYELLPIFDNSLRTIDHPAERRLPPGEFGKKEIKTGKVNIKELSYNLNVYKIIREELYKESPSINTLNKFLREKIDNEDLRILQFKTDGRENLQSYFIYERNFNFCFGYDVLKRQKGNEQAMQAILNLGRRQVLSRSIVSEDDISHFIHKSLKWKFIKSAWQKYFFFRREKTENKFEYRRVILENDMQKSGISIEGCFEDYVSQKRRELEDLITAINDPMENMHPEDKINYIKSEREEINFTKYLIRGLVSDENWAKRRFYELREEEFK